jgi:hypothetical protein
MLGRKDYTREELEQGKKAVKQQLSAYKKLVNAIDGGAGNPAVAPALKEFETLLFNNMVLVLDRYFVHRLRSSTGKDGNPLNEVELLSDSLMNNRGELRGNNVIKYKPEQSVLKLELGDTISLSATDFERLAKAFLADIDSKFVK